MPSDSSSPFDDVPADAGVADAAIAEYLRRMDREEPVSREDFILEHPEVAEPLRAFFAAADLFESIAGPTRREINESLLGEGPFEEDEEGVVLLESAATRYVGRYRILRKIGQGAMGEVFLAHDTQLDRQVALKLPTIAPGDSDQLLERFYREARAAAGLQHPNICSIFDIGCDGDQHYISMAYIDGGTLADQLAAGQRYAPYQATGIVRKLALALEHAHQAGVVHRDLKPSNVLINAAGEPIVTDFGLARRLFAEDIRVTRTGAILGSPAYLAPEQIAADNRLDENGKPREQDPQLAMLADIYGLGVIYYELLTGRVPFSGSVASVLMKIVSETPVPPSDRNPAVDPFTSDICMTLLAKRPEDRYPDMAALAAALDEALVPPTHQRPAETSPNPPVVLFPDSESLVPVTKPGLPEHEAFDDGDRALRNSLIGIGAGLLFAGCLFLGLGIYFWRIASQDNTPQSLPLIAPIEPPPPTLADSKPTSPPPSIAPPPVQTRPATSVASNLSSLRYGFQASELYPFEVDIVAEMSDGNLVFRGTPVLVAQESDELGTKLVLRGGLIAHEEARHPLRWHSMSMSPFGVFSSYAGLLGSGPPGEHSVTVGRRGNVKAIRGNSQLPLLLGNLSQLMLDEFPEANLGEWSVTQDASYQAAESQYPYFMPSHTRPGYEGAVGQRTITYAVRSYDETSGRVVLTKQVATKLSKSGRQYSFQGEGEVLFDLREGRPLKMTMQGVANAFEFTEPVRVTITYSQLDRAVYEQRMKEAADRLAEANAAREQAEAEARLPVTAEDWKTLSTTLAVGDNAAIQKATARLKNTQELSNGLREEVVVSLLQALNRNKDVTTQRALIEAAARYVTDKSAPQLMGLIDHADIQVRKTVIQTLGYIGDPRVARLLATRLTDGFDREPAVAALKRLGPAAEPAVLPLLEEQDRWLRAAAVDVLQEVGGKDSIEALAKTATDDSDPTIRTSAANALKAIDARSALND